MAQFLILPFLALFAREGLTATQVNTFTATTLFHPASTTATHGPSWANIPCYDEGEVCAQYGVAIADCTAAWARHLSQQDLDSCQCGARHLWFDAVNPPLPLFHPETIPSLCFYS